MSKGLKIMSLGVINHGMSLSVLYLPFLYWSYLPFLYWSYLPFYIGVISLFVELSPFFILELSYRSSSNHLASCPCGSLKFISQVRLLWSVLTVKCLPNK